MIACVFFNSLLFFSFYDFYLKVMSIYFIQVYLWWTNFWLANFQSFAVLFHNIICLIPSTSIYMFIQIWYILWCSHFTFFADLLFNDTRKEKKTHIYIGSINYYQNLHTMQNNFLFIWSVTLALVVWIECLASSHLQDL